MSRPRHRGLISLLLGLATLAAILGAGALWVHRDLLDPGRWQTTSGRILAHADVRRAVSRFAVTRALDAAGVDEALDRALPGSLAHAARSRLQHAASGAAAGVLADPSGRRAWREANRQAIAGLLRASGHPGASDGVELQLTPLLADILSGIKQDAVVQAIPGAADALSLHGIDAGRLQLLTPAQVRAVVPGVRAVRVLAWALPLLTVVLLALVLLLARGWRARALSRVGYALLLAGGVLLGLRAVLGTGLADALVSGAGDRAAVSTTWLTASVPLRTEAIFLLLAGAIIALGSWLIRAIL